MTLFEFSILVGLAIVIALLVRIEKILKTTFAIRERQSLEATVRDFMPTLWVNPEFREGLIPWFALAFRPYDKRREKEWHWPAIEDNLKMAASQESTPTIPPEEVERLKNLSSEFFREAESSHLLTELEVRYLLFRTWKQYFRDPTLVRPNDVRNFEDELSNIRKRFLTQTERR